MFHPTTSTPAPPQADSLVTTPIDLPDELIEGILSKCDDVKSVARFKSVSKSWQSIISNPRFLRSLRSIQSENQNKFFVYAGPPLECDDHLYLITFKKDGGFRREPVLGYPFGKSKTTPVCSCDGLILLQRIPAGLMLWNPLIGKHINIPSSFNSISHPRTFGNHAPKNRHLYYDSTTDDHKIVFVYKDFYVVYSCENKIWGEEKDLPQGVDRKFCIDGIIYGLKDYEEIICLDTRDGKVHKLELPNDVRGGKVFELEAVSGRPCLYFWEGYGKLLQLWVMEENRSFVKRWRKVMGMEKALRYVRMLSPVWLSNEDDVVLWGVVDVGGMYDIIKHFLYNSRENGSFQEIDWNYFSACFPYSESLYLPSSDIC